MSNKLDVDYGGITWEVEFNYSPGSPGCHTLRNGDPGYPEEPAEYEFLAIRLEGNETDLTEFLLESVVAILVTKVEENYEPNCYEY